MKQTVRQRKAEKLRLYSIGYMEDENYNWFCKQCKQAKLVVECTCDICKGGCEICNGKILKRYNRT